MSDEASKSEESNYADPPEGLQTDSVRDFLYHDARRVASFLAQFEGHGSLQQTKAMEQIASSSSSKTGVQGKVNALVASGHGQVDLTRSDEERDSAERVYDPIWRNALALLDFLEERGLVKRRLADARIGDFVLISGQLILLDAAFLKAAWDKPAIQKMLLAGMKENSEASGNREERRKNASQQKSELVDHLNLVVGLLSMMPHAVQGRLISSSANAWFTLDEEAIVGRSSDLILKHGSLVTGDWAVLGVLDALPEARDNEEMEIVARIIGSPIGVVSAHLQPLARNMMGRPEMAHGIMPLLIYRTVAEPDPSDS